LLRNFAGEQSGAPEQIAEALARRDVATAERLAHTLKGVAGNLGANDVHAAAGRLEKLLRDRSASSDVEAARQHLASVLAPLVAGLQTALGADGPGGPGGPGSNIAPAPATTIVDAARSREAGAQLRALLSDSDPGAGDFVDANRDALRPLFDAAHWTEFEKLVQGYDFGAAQTQLEQALEAAAGTL
jgi:two-component system sensor histidine kinase/response regulator